MIKKLRLQISAVCMVLLLLVITATVSTIYLISKKNIETNTTAALQSALNRDMSQKTNPGESEYSTPVFVAQVYPTGTVRIYGSSYYSYENQEQLLHIVSDTISRPENTGILDTYQLRYYREESLLYTSIAYTDCSFEQATLRSLLMATILIGLCAFTVLSGLSILLSYFVTKPVANAWTSQQRFLSDASHELKTPLTVILSSADLLQGSVDDMGRIYVDNIQEEGKRMKTLVESMLSLSRLQNTSALPEMSRIDLSDLVTDETLRFEPVCFEAGHELVSYIDEGIAVNGDSKKLSQLLEILLDNANKYTTKNAPICLRLYKRGQKAMISVENASQPIPEEKLPHLFDRFYRVDEARTDISGFGLGLSIAQDIVKQHHGTISCQNGSGTVYFTIILPLVS